MSKVTVEFQHSEDIPNINNGIKLLIDFFEINKFHPSDAISIVSNFVVNGFLNEDEEMFDQYLRSLKMAYEMNRERKIGRSAKKQK